MLDDPPTAVTPPSDTPNSKNSSDAFAEPGGSSLNMTSNATDSNVHATQQDPSSFMATSLAKMTFQGLEATSINSRRRNGPDSIDILRYTASFTVGYPPRGFHSATGESYFDLDLPRDDLPDKPQAVFRIDSRATGTFDNGRPVAHLAVQNLLDKDLGVGNYLGRGNKTLRRHPLSVG